MHVEIHGTCLGTVLRRKTGTREAHISEARKRNVEVEMKAEATEEGRSLVMRKFLMKPREGCKRTSPEK
jgi:hypothetical protein